MSTGLAAILPPSYEAATDAPSAHNSPDWYGRFIAWFNTHLESVFENMKRQGHGMGWVGSVVDYLGGTTPYAPPLNFHERRELDEALFSLYQGLMETYDPYGTSTGAWDSDTVWNENNLFARRALAEIIRFARLFGFMEKNHMYRWMLIFTKNQRQRSTFLAALQRQNPARERLVDITPLSDIVTQEWSAAHAPGNGRVVGPDTEDSAYVGLHSDTTTEPPTPKRPRRLHFNKDRVDPARVQPMTMETINARAAAMRPRVSEYQRPGAPRCRAATHPAQHPSGSFRPVALHKSVARLRQSDMDMDVDPVDSGVTFPVRPTRPDTPTPAHGLPPAIQQ